MRKSDMAIVTPSVTLNEIFYMNRPFIAIQTADNQDDMYNYLRKKKLPVLKRFKDTKLTKYVEKLLNRVDENVK